MGWYEDRQAETLAEWESYKTLGESKGLVLPKWVYQSWLLNPTTVDLYTRLNQHKPLAIGQWSEEAQEAECDLDYSSTFEGLLNQAGQEVRLWDQKVGGVRGYVSFGDKPFVALALDGNIGAPIDFMVAPEADIKYWQTQFPNLWFGGPYSDEWEM